MISTPPHECQICDKCPTCKNKMFNNLRIKLINICEYYLAIDNRAVISVGDFPESVIIAVAGLYSDFGWDVKVRHDVETKLLLSLPESCEKNHV